MTGLTPNAYAAKQKWRFRKGALPEHLITEYLKQIAYSCASVEECVIGHIKALAVFPGGTYFRASVVSPKLPAGTEGTVPSTCKDLELLVNAIVYGLDRAVLEDLVRRATAHFSGKDVEIG